MGVTCVEIKYSRIINMLMKGKMERRITRRKTEITFIEIFSVFLLVKLCERLNPIQKQITDLKSIFFGFFSRFFYGIVCARRALTIKLFVVRKMSMPVSNHFDIRRNL